MNFNRHIVALASLLTLATGQFDCLAFTHEGITYEPISDTEVAITHGDLGLSGEIILPGKMGYQGVNYTVSSIRDGAFVDCVDLSSILIPSTICSIGNDAFNYCQSLKRVYLGGGDRSVSPPLSFGYIPNLNDGLFADAHLTSLYLGRNVEYNKRRGFSPFSGQAHLAFVEIDLGVSELPDYLFANCTSLSEIRLNYYSTPPTVAETAFLNVDKNKCRIVLESGSVEEVAKAEGWKEFKNIVYAWDSSTESIDVETAADVVVANGAVVIKNCPGGSLVSVFSLDGTKVAEADAFEPALELRLNPGLYILVVKAPTVRKVVKVAI